MDTRRGLAPGAADDIRRGEDTRRGVGVRYYGKWKKLSKGFPKCQRVGMERGGQNRRVVVASMILGLREGLHGEGGGLTSGSEREGGLGGRSGQKVVVVFGCGNPVGFWAWAEDLVLGRGLGVGEVQLSTFNSVPFLSVATAGPTTW